jgi:hypothetical protein
MSSIVNLSLPRPSLYLVKRRALIALRQGWLPSEENVKAAMELLERLAYEHHYALDCCVAVERGPLASEVIIQTCESWEQVSGVLVHPMRQKGVLVQLVEMYLRQPPMPAVWDMYGREYHIQVEYRVWAKYRVQLMWAKTGRSLF